MPKAISWDATPQQAEAKNVELSIAASAPSVAASGDNFNARKNVHAPTPTMNRAMGARNLAKPTGPSSQVINALMPGEYAPAM